MEKTSPPNIQTDRNEQIRQEYFGTQRVRAGRPSSKRTREGTTVAEIAKKYGISRARVYAIVGGRKGGANMPGKKRYTATLPTASIEKSKLDKLEQIAANRGTSLAFIEREAIDEYLARHSTEIPQTATVTVN